MLNRWVEFYIIPLFQDAPDSEHKDGLKYISILLQLVATDIWNIAIVLFLMAGVDIHFVNNPKS